jgi:zinc protease
LSKGALSQSLAGRFETSDQSAGTVGELFTFELPVDYYQQLPARIAAVTAEDVQQAAKKYIHPESAVVIGAGDRSKIEEQLKKLQIGKVEVRDSDGNRVAEKAAGQGQ